jgi:hypothetical protein
VSSFVAAICVGDHRRGNRIGGELMFGQIMFVVIVAGTLWGLMLGVRPR